MQVNSVTPYLVNYYSLGLGLVKNCEIWWKMVELCMDWESTEVVVGIDEFVLISIMLH